MKRIVSMFAGLALGCAAGAALAQDLTAVHEDEKHDFRLRYPADWADVRFEDGPDFHVMANGGRGPEECMVVIDPAAAPTS